MQSRSCCLRCRCGNMSLIADPLKESGTAYVKRRLGLSKIPRVFRNHSIFEIDDGSIKVNNLARITSKVAEKCIADVECLECGSRLYILIGGETDLCPFCTITNQPETNNKMPKVRPRSYSIGSTGISTLPEKFKKMFFHKMEAVERKDTEKCDDDSLLYDDDFELMFSNQPSPDLIVGGFSEIGRFASDSTYLSFAD